MKKIQRTFTKTRSSALCGFAAGSVVSVRVGRMLTAHVGNIYRCGSSWSCALCAPVIRQQRALEIDGGLSRWLERGGGAVFVSLTLRHHLGDRLVDRLDVIARSWHLTAQGSAWKRWCAEVGYVGVIKAVEVTWTPANGWHPHSHLVLITERPITDEQGQALHALLYGRWSQVAERNGFGTITKRRGVDVRPIVNEAQIGDYLVKLSVDPQNGWTAGLELARSDVKKGRTESWTPFGMLQEVLITGESRWLRLFGEYEQATFGRASIRWSPGLRKRLCGSDDERSDVELAASEGIDLHLVEWLGLRAVWNRAVRAGTESDLLDEIEWVTAALLYLCDFFGHVPQPLHSPTQEEVLDG